MLTITYTFTLISIPWVSPLLWLILQVISYCCCCCSVAKLCLTFCNPLSCSTPGFPFLHSLPEFAQTYVHGVGDAIQLSHPLLSPSPSAFNLSQHQGLFQRVGFSHQVARVLEFQLPVASVLTNECSVLISFRIDWFDLLAIQGTLKSLLQHHNSKASALRHSVFFIIQLSHPYMTTGKTIALTRWTFVGKVVSLPFNMLSRFVIAFLSRSKCLLISWLQALSAVILELKKRKSVTASTSPLLFAMKWWDWMPWS